MSAIGRTEWRYKDVYSVPFSMICVTFAPSGSATDRLPASEA
jgi:hypothetical protein